MSRISTWREALRLALQALKAYKLRAMLSVLAVSLGSASIILVVTFSLATRRYVISEIEAVGSNLVQAEMLDAGASQNLTFADEITPEDLRAVQREVPQLRQVAGSNDLRMTVRIGRQVNPVGLVGVTDGFNKIRNLIILSGRYLDEDEMKSREKVCVISEQLASSMFPDRDPLDADLVIGELHFTVIGVFRERTATFGTNGNHVGIRNCSFSVNQGIHKQGLL